MANEIAKTLPTIDVRSHCGSIGLRVPSRMSGDEAGLEAIARAERFLLTAPAPFQCSVELFVDRVTDV